MWVRDGEYRILRKNYNPVHPVGYLKNGCKTLTVQRDKKIEAKPLRWQTQRCPFARKCMAAYLQ